MIEKKLTSVISLVFRWGVLLSGAMIVFGWWMSFVEKGSTLKSFKNYSAESLSEKLHWIFLTQDRSALLSYLGIFILLSLPSIRVVLAAIHFAQHKEKLLALISMVVYLLLLTGLFLAI